MIEGENDELLQNRIVYARACSAGASLGKKCVGKEGCFIGYKHPFKFICDKTRNGNPDKDNLAKKSLQPSNELARCLIDGKSADSAVKCF